MVEPKGDLAPRLVKYLLNNRRAAKHWNSTRDTALVIEAMADYALASGEAIGDEAMEIEVWLDGQRRQTLAITPAEALRGEGRFVLLGEELASGRHTLELRKRSEGRLYTGASLTNFSLEPDIRAAGLELRVERQLHRLEPIEATGDTVDARGGAQTIPIEKYRRVALPNLGSVKSGDLIEVELKPQQQKRLRVPTDRRSQAGRLRTGRSSQRLQPSWGLECLHRVPRSTGAFPMYRDSPGENRRFATDCEPKPPAHSPPCRRKSPQCTPPTYVATAMKIRVEIVDRPAE